MYDMSESFKRKVREEIEHIKDFATEEEINRLDFDTFSQESRVKCIYGQMTGRCDSKRARELCAKTFKYVYEDGVKGENFTALEVYIYNVGRYNSHKILKYLKGEIDTIEL